MTNAEKLAALQPFVHENFRWDFTRQPFVYAGVAYATDCHILVRLPAPGEPDTPNVGRKFIEQLPRMYPDAEPHAFDAGDLRQWLGPLTKDARPCYVCGTFDPPIEPQDYNLERLPNVNGPGCETCGGKGWEIDRPEADPVRVFGETFDGYYLRLALTAPFVQGVPFGTIGVPEPIPDKGVEFAGRPASFTLGDARFLLMPLDVAPDRKDIPTYHPGIGALWHLRTTNARCVLIDWCLERGVELTDLEGVPF